MNATRDGGSQDDITHDDEHKAPKAEFGYHEHEPHESVHRERVLEALGQHESSLTRYAARLTGDEHAARDVVQHVFLQLCDQPPTARNGQLAGWLFSVCHNRAMDYRRKSVRSSSLETVPPENLSRSGNDPADKAEADDSVELLRSVIDTLPPTQRLVVNLWSAGSNYREIAKALDSSEGSVRVASHRAWQAIRQHPKVRKLLDD